MISEALKARLLHTFKQFRRGREDLGPLEIRQRQVQAHVVGVILSPIDVMAKDSRRSANHLVSVERRQPDVEVGNPRPDNDDAGRIRPTPRRLGREPGSVSDSASVLPALLRR